MKTLPRRLQRAVVLLATFLFLLPVFAYSFSIGDERLIGEQLLYAVRGEFELIDDPDIAQYINDLGRQVLATAGPQYFDYHFFVVKNSQFNAFAAPSGLIFFNTGLIKTMKSEDQLISVMAHEIGHVTSRHISSRMAKQSKVTALSMLFGLASLAVGDPALTQGLFTSAMAAGSAAGLSFSRQDEEQADRLAFDWLRNMGRDPNAMEDMLKTMRRITRYSSEQLPPYLLTHPNPEDRLNYVQSLIERDHSKPAGQLKAAAKDRFAFLRFKYRVLSQSLEPDEMRNWCAGTIASGKDAEEISIARYGLALLSAQEMDFSGAVKQMEEVRQDFPGREILDIDLAVLRLEAGQTAQALQLLRRAHERDATDIYAAFHLAKALEKSGDLSEAEQLHLEIVKVRPDYPQVYYELGRLKSRQGKTNASNFYLAKHYLYKGRVKDAKQYLQRAEKDQSLPNSLREEARSILERLKKIEDAS
ncbi:MAG: putative Zn-dependent protease [Candidatus Electronema aureum]|uniref:Zn-dependent protease n=1 Tax=Candidatus Electronema aureum TaxID=2005002 RepID=A0A521G483_9BACT|nr:MAG: putative Zn-dependent protease [Candidatus Electronema aureum]